jgi:hypothetical protein
LNMEVLRSKSLLSSRGIVERVLQLTAAELGLKGRFNATATIMKVSTLDVQNHPKGKF